MYCPKCGFDNPDKNLFCNKCGAELGRKQNQKPLEEGPAKKSKNKIIIGIIIGALIIAAAITGIIIYMNNEKSSEYDSKIKKADKYAQKQDYENAEACYLEAIEFYPSKDTAYIELSDIYIAQRHYYEAETLLDKGNDAAGGSNIAEKLSEAQTYCTYSDFVNDSCIPDSGLVDVDKIYSSDHNMSGLISTVMKDVDDDDKPELITITSDDSNATKITITLYECSDNEEIEKIGSDTQDIWGQYDMGSKADVFMKEYGDSYYLILSSEELGTDGGFDKTIIYDISSGFEKLHTLGFGVGMGYIYYSIDGDDVAEYSYELGEDGDDDDFNDAYKNTLNKGVEQFKSILSSYGMSDRITADESRLTASEKDPLETRICYIQHGTYLDDGYLDFSKTDRIKIEDYTEMRIQ